MKKVLLLIILSFLFVSTNAQQINVGTGLLPNMPMPIANNAVSIGWENGTASVYSFGGIDSTKIWSGITRKSFQFNTLSGIWDTIPDLPNPNAVIAAGASYVDSIIYIMGGYQVLSNGSEISSNIVNRFDPRTNTYLSDGANIPVPIDDHVQAVYNDSLIYTITGWSNTGNVPDVQIYDPGNDNWLTGTAVPNNNTYRAFGASGTIIGDSIFYHGGASTAFNFPGQNTLRIGAINPLDPTQITWTDQSTPYVRYRAACANYNNNPIWFGGSEITYNYNGIAYNGSGGVPLSSNNLYWNGTNLDTTIGAVLPMDLRGIANFTDGSNSVGSSIIAGGMDNGQQVSNKVYLIDFWITTSIEENDKPNSFKLYPNPSSQNINLVFEKMEKRTISLINILGEVILQLKSDKSTLQLDISNYLKGIYFVQVKSDKGISSQKVIIQ